MNIKIKLYYKQQKMFNKLYGKNLGREIAMGRNLLKEIIEKFPSPKNEIIAHNPRHQKIAHQMTQLLNHQIMEDRASSLQSLTQNSSEWGGNLLCFTDDGIVNCAEDLNKIEAENKSY